jgi:hypothetical protein
VGYVIMKKALELMEGSYVELLAAFDGTFGGGGE